MPGGRPQKSAKLLEMSGAFKKNPKRARERVARAHAVKEALPPIGPPPQDWLDRAPNHLRFQRLVHYWESFVKQDEVLNVLNSSHRVLMEIACLLRYQIDEAITRKGRAPSGDYAQLKSTLSAMKMTPADGTAAEVLPPSLGRSAGMDGPDWGQYGSSRG